MTDQERAALAQEPVAWAGCGECDCAFPCHDGEAKCIRLPLQQAEPVQEQADKFYDANCTWADHAPGCVRAEEQAEQVQKPVAWIEHGLIEAPDGLVWERGSVGYYTPLYTAPPQRKPLTQEEITTQAEKVLKPSVYYDAEALLGTDGLVALVRAVEAKHGIKE